MLPAIYIAAMISKSCRNFMAVGCGAVIHCLLTFCLVIQVLPVNYHLAAVRQSCLDCAVAVHCVSGRTAHKHTLKELVHFSHNFREFNTPFVQLLLAVAMAHRLQCS